MSLLEKRKYLSSILLMSKEDTPPVVDWNPFRIHNYVWFMFLITGAGIDGPGLCRCARWWPLMGTVTDWSQCLAAASPAPGSSPRDTGWCHRVTGIEGWARRGEADISSIVSSTYRCRFFTCNANLSRNVFQKKGKGFQLFEISCQVCVLVLSLTISASRAKNSDNYVSIEMLSLSHQTKYWQL